MIEAKNNGDIVPAGNSTYVSMTRCLPVRTLCSNFIWLCRRSSEKVLDLCNMVADGLLADSFRVNLLWDSVWLVFRTWPIAFASIVVVVLLIVQTGKLGSNLLVSLCCPSVVYAT